MSIKTTPHLDVRGEARAAPEFYRSVLGGEVAFATYGDLGMPKAPRENGTTVTTQPFFVSDWRPSSPPVSQGPQPDRPPFAGLRATQRDRTPLRSTSFGMKRTRQ